mmetsp:Transcript_18438/g.50615  ORF Transcript_18438/g.50615 Transcript_18438/m.50615 type:complete len:209 (+) Transcript_18438:344-970(+)
MHQSDQAMAAHHDEHVPTQGRDVARLQGLHVDATLQHAFELEGERKGRLCDQKAREEVRDPVREKALRHHENHLILHHPHGHHRVLAARKCVHRILRLRWVLHQHALVGLQKIGLARFEGALAQVVRVGPQHPAPAQHVIRLHLLHVNLRGGFEDGQEARTHHGHQDDHKENWEQHIIANMRIKQNGCHRNVRTFNGPNVSIASAAAT